MPDSTDHQTADPDARAVTAPLNVACACVTLDRRRLGEALTAAFGDAGFAAGLADSHPHLISAQPVFVSSAEIAAISHAVAAIEAACALPGVVGAVAARAPDIATTKPGPIGLFMGYDFHLTANGPKLIEINTNAGGALLNAYLREAHRTCCQHLGTSELPSTLDAVLDSITAAFDAEWRLHCVSDGKTGTQLGSVAIIDRTPQAQYLYPEFRLFERLLRSRGISASIADPADLNVDGSRLTLSGKPIDFVYNRLTDFYFAEPWSAALRSAYDSRVVAVSPNPWAHAHYADKRNLVSLSCPRELFAMGLPAPYAETLAKVVPATSIVTPETADDAWSRRDRLFFKPFGGHGGKAAYRGDKLTRKVFAEIANGGYIAQDVVAPSIRTVMVDGIARTLKTDVRAYTYAGRIQLVAARLYQGQTTNFRTPGGGFAPVLVVDDVMATCGCHP